MNRKTVFAVLFAVAVLNSIQATAQTTQFTHHGNLGFAANGNGYDIELTLFDTPAVGAGTPQGKPYQETGVQMTDGEFTVQPDFGAAVFTGAELFLETGWRASGSGAFTVLPTRERITAVYANRSLSAATADSATNSTQLGGLPPSSFIQNTPSQQSGSFNISGDGTAGGTLSAATLNAGTQYSIAGRRVLTVNGPYDDGTTTFRASNTFAGSDAGLNTTPATSFAGSSGKFNSFFGGGAGQANTAGFDNAFFGTGAGQANVQGFRNSFFGTRAGSRNSSGDENAFFGEEAGLRNSTGAENSFFGAYVGSNNTTGSENSFVGYYAGYFNSTGMRNAFFGYQAGVAGNGSSNSFFGSSAGASSRGNANSFFGDSAGISNFSGENNAFFGINAGSLNVAGSNNTAFGGVSNFTASNTTGNNNTLLGFASKVTTDLSNQTAIGALAQVSQSNSLVLGSINGVNGATADTNVGIGTTAPAARLHVSGSGAVRARVNSDSNAGLALTVNNQPKWSLATVTGGRFQIFNDATGQNAVLIDPVSNNFGIGPGPDAPNAKLHVRVNSGNILIGDAGCSGNFGGIGFGASMSGCTNYSLLGEGVHTYINRPSGGSVFFREANNTQMSINPGGTVSINVLGGGGTTQLCRNSSNQISTCSSSVRYKTNIAPFIGGLNLVNRLQPITFNWRANGEADLGLGAEDVAQIEPLLVIHNEKGEVEGVKYDRVSIVLLNAIKEQQAQIETLKRIVCMDHPNAEMCGANPRTDRVSEAKP